MGLPNSELPLCSCYEDYKKWSESYDCKVAIDENVGDDLFRVLDDEKTVMIKVVTQKNANIVKKLRKHRFSNKVRGFYDNFDSILK